MQMKIPKQDMIAFRMKVLERLRATSTIEKMVVLCHWWFWHASRSLVDAPISKVNQMEDRAIRERETKQTIGQNIKKIEFKWSVFKCFIVGR